MPRRFKTPILAVVLLCAMSGAYAQVRTTSPTLVAPWVKSISVPCFGGVALTTTTTTITKLTGACPGGFELRVKVTLERPAPSPYLQVYASSTDITHAPAPPTRIYEGNTEGTILIRTTPVAVNTPVTIEAWTSAEDKKSDSFTLVPPSLTKIELSPTTLLGGIEDQVVQGVAYFNGPPAAASTIQLQLQVTSSASVTPSSAYLPMSTLTIPFTVKPYAVGDVTNVTVTGTSGVVAKSGTFSIKPPSLIGWGTWDEGGNIMCSGSCDCFAPCSNGMFPILDGPAPAGGTTVQISTPQPGVVALTQSAVVIPAGQKYPANPRAFYVSVKAETPPQNAVVNASYGGATISNTLAVKPPKKGDFWVTAPAFKDQFGNTITTIPDSYPVTMCTTVRGCEKEGDTITLNCFSHEPVGAVLSLNYTNNSGFGRTASFPVDFDGDGSIYIYPGRGYFHQQTGVSICTQLPGLANPGDWYEIKLNVDPTNAFDEIHDGNNTRTVKIYR